MLIFTAVILQLLPGLALSNHNFSFFSFSIREALPELLNIKLMVRKKASPIAIFINKWCLPGSMGLG